MPPESVAVDLKPIGTPSDGDNAEISDDSTDSESDFVLVPADENEHETNRADAQPEPVHQFETDSESDGQSDDESSDEPDDEPEADSKAESDHDYDADSESDSIADIETNPDASSEPDPKPECAGTTAATDSGQSGTNTQPRHEPSPAKVAFGYALVDMSGFGNARIVELIQQLHDQLSRRRPEKPNPHLVVDLGLVEIDVSAIDSENLWNTAAQLTELLKARLP